MLAPYPAMSPGVSSMEFFLENMDANLCNLMTPDYENWDGNSMIFHHTFKSGTESTALP